MEKIQAWIEKHLVPVINKITGVVEIENKP